MVSSIIKVCPKAEELSVVRVNIPCPVDGCSSVLPHAGSLRIHLSKTHRITEDSDGTTSAEKSDGDQNVIKQYHCPVQNCVYNVLSKRHFTSRKLLKQHYMKVHADKKHKCTKCGQGFGLERDCRRHLQTCGIIFHCKTCDCPFSSIEATINHCNIKQHEIPEECKNLRSNKLPSSMPPRTILILQTAPPNPLPSPSIQGNSFTSGTSVLRPLLPKPIINATILPAAKTIRTSEMAAPSQLLIAPFVEKSPPPITAASRSISIQTDCEKNLIALTPSAPVNTVMPYLHNPRPNYCRNIAQTDCTFFDNPGRKVGKRLSKDTDYSLHKFTSSTGIQTAVSVPPVKKKSHRNMVGTQTVGDYILTTAMSSAQIPIRRISQGSQVNPHGKQRTQKNYTMESSHTQTMEMQSPRWKKRRRASTVQQNDQNQIPSSDSTPSFLLLKEMGSSGELTDNHTQTNVSNSAPAISTQTHMSCLINSLTNGRSGPENCSSFSSQQSTETQTISSVLQHVMAKNVNSLYPMADTYDQPAHPQPMSFSTLEDPDLPKNSDTTCNNELVGTKSLLENNMESTMQTEPEMSLIYSSLTDGPVSTSLASQVPHNTYPSFTANLNQDIDDSNCTSLLSTLTNPHTNTNFVCETSTIDSSISHRSQLPGSDPDKAKEIAHETNTELPFRSFINQNLSNTECSLPSFSNSDTQRNSLNQFHSLESIANQESEDEKRKSGDHNGTSSGLLCSLVNKDPILCSSTAFSDIGDSNDVLNYTQIGPFDNERHFASTGTSPLDITDSSLLTFEKGIGTGANNGNTESFLLQPSKDEPNTNKLDSQHSSINDITNKSFFHSTLGHTGESRSESSKEYMNSSMNTESDFSSGQLCLDNSRSNLETCSSKLFNNDKGVGTDPCRSHCLGLPSSTDMYSVPSNVLTTSSPERRTISTCMDDLMNDERLTLSNAGCGSLMSTQFAPLVADIEVQTLALDNDFEALLNSSEHSRSSSSVIDMYTQTVEDMLDLFGNTTETQTTVDDTFFPGLEFTDIETQTTAGELDCLETRSLITAGTQTTLSNQNLSRDVEFSDMETQTGFNVCDLDTFLTDSHTQTTFDELEDFLSGLNSQV